MSFADDIVLVGESREEINEKLELRREGLEAHSFCISGSKTEYIECTFGKRHTNSHLKVKIGMRPYHKSQDLSILVLLSKMMEKYRET